MPTLSKNHSASTSAAAGIINTFTQRNQAAPWGRVFNEVIEAGPSVVNGSITMSRGNHSASPSVRGNKNVSIERMGWRKKPSNEVRHPNRHIWSSNNNHGDFRRRPFNEMSPSYRAPNGMAPHMKFPQPNMIPCGIAPSPILPVPFIGNLEPSTSTQFQGVIVFPYASYGTYYYPTNPHARCFIPYQDIYAAQQSHFSNLFNDLRTRLRKQIEYYFCSENLEKDFYLKRHMDANGWVPISLIEEFRRVKALMIEVQRLYNHLSLLYIMPDQITQLTSNKQFISDSLRPSYDVEVQGDKMRKRFEWEKWISPQIQTQSNAESHDQPQTTQN